MSVQWQETKQDDLIWWKESCNNFVSELGFFLMVLG